VKATKIYLVGFMASGKTSLARSLAKRLDWPSIDIDDLVEVRERMAVAEIFARRGEPYFRTVERAVLFEQLGRSPGIVATGGGTFADPANRSAINADGVSIWLDVPLERIIARLPSDGRRPLAADRAELERLYHQRRSSYQQAHVHLDASRTSVDALAEQVLDWLGT
jgi:shikimate kinase